MPTSTRGPAELRGLALRTLFPGFTGTDVPPQRLLDLVHDGLGGVVLFARNVDPSRGDAGVAALTAALRSARPDLLVAVDEEGGDVTRLDAATGSEYPGAAALGAIDDPQLTLEVAAALGTRLRTCGIDLNFAPVADVDTDPRNPVIGVRAFGADPDLVARHVAAFVRGQQATGVAATAKHFPGHGGTAEDSHVTVPVLEAPPSVLADRELVPFRAALAAGSKVVMTAHIRVPALDGESPATLSPAVVTGLLRTELGYGGLVMTDGLDMRAISGTIGQAEGAVRALIAGVDAICIGGDTTDPAAVDEIAAAIVRAVESGRLRHARLAEAAGRVRALAGWTRQPSRAAEPATAEPRTAEPRTAELTTGELVNGEPPGRRAARRAVTALGVVGLTVAPLVLELREEPTLAAGPVPWGIGRPLAARLPGTVVVGVTESGPPVSRVLGDHPGRPVVIAVRGVRRRPWQLAAVASARQLRPDAVVVDHELSEPGTFEPPFVLTYGASRVAAEVAADLLSPVDHAIAARHAELPD
jgi:beta-N-acetylhexosaminidase